MHVAQILLSPRIGGAESLAASLASEWSKSGVSSEIIYLDADGQANSRLARVLRVRRALRSSKPDLVIAHSALPNLYARLASPLSGGIVTVLHSASDDFRGRLMRVLEIALRFRTRAVVAVSHAQANQYRGHFPKSRNVLVIPNGVRGDLPLKQSYNQAPRVVATLARVAAQKDPQLWVETVEETHAQHPGLAFQWWGPLATESLSELVVNQNESSASGKFMGPTDDPAGILLAADIFFHPSSREAHSIGLLEAAAVGLPIVCSYDVAATAPDGVASQTFGGPNGLSAAAALDEIVSNWGPRYFDRSALAASIRETYSMAACAEQYLTLARSPTAYPAVKNV